MIDRALRAFFNEGMTAAVLRRRGARFCLLLLLWEGFFCPCHGLLRVTLVEKADATPSCCSHCEAERAAADCDQAPSADESKCEEGCCAPCLHSEKADVDDFPSAGAADIPDSWSMMWSRVVAMAGSLSHLRPGINPGSFTNTSPLRL